MQPGDPRADPAVVDLIELAGLWLAAGDRPALARTLRRLDAELSSRFASEAAFSQRFRELLDLVERRDPQRPSDEELRRTYRRATVG
jgi:hypothetical protein